MTDEQTDQYRLTSGRIDLNDGRTLTEGDTFVPTARQLEYYGTKLALAGGTQPAQAGAERRDAADGDGDTDGTHDPAAAQSGDGDGDADAPPAGDGTADATESDGDETDESATADAQAEDDGDDDQGLPGGYEAPENFVSRALDETGPDGLTIEESIERIQDPETIREVYEAEQAGRGRTTVKDDLDAREAELSDR
jgi:hypothetical protein